MTERSIALRISPIVSEKLEQTNIWPRLQYFKQKTNSGVEYFWMPISVAKSIVDEVKILLPDSNIKWPEGFQ